VKRTVSADGPLLPLQARLISGSAMWSWKEPLSGGTRSYHRLAFDDQIFDDRGALPIIEHWTFIVQIPSARRTIGTSQFPGD
jgi:hypothetical protein